MIKSQYNVIGVMSGTSLDGIDIAHISFTLTDRWDFSINQAITIEYSKEWKEILRNLVDLDIEELKELDVSYTNLLSSKINAFIVSIPELDIDLISSHGHTALHQPKSQLTYQIGNLPSISKLTNKLVVCDFRVQDVMYGGQGAPLVPIGDRLLFPEYDACINLGGFANTSFERNGNRIAFDICPVNIVLNYYAEQLGKSFDDEGQMARKGKINTKLLNQLNDHSYYRADPPKSLGLEWVKEHVFPVLDQSGSSIQDILCTYVEHISIQISETMANESKVIITGGGAFNTYLLERLNKLKSVNYVVPSNSVVNYKEALIFGLLGVLKLRGEINCLTSVTGARHDHSSGVIYYP